MNHTPTPSDAQWQAQEDALAQARANRSAARQDRMLLEAMRAPPSLALPDAFARDVARLATRASNADETRVEYRITAALGVCLGLGGTWVTIRDGAAWWQASVGLLPGATGTGWVSALAACVLASWLATLLTGRLRLTLTR